MWFLLQCNIVGCRICGKQVNFKESQNLHRNRIVSKLQMIIHPNKMRKTLLFPTKLNCRTKVNPAVWRNEWSYKNLNTPCENNKAYILNTWGTCTVPTLQQQHIPQLVQLTFTIGSKSNCFVHIMATKLCNLRRNSINFLVKLMQFPSKMHISSNITCDVVNK